MDIEKVLDPGLEKSMENREMDFSVMNLCTYIHAHMHKDKHALNTSITLNAEQMLSNDEGNFSKIKNGPALKHCT